LGTKQLDAGDVTSDFVDLNFGTFGANTARLRYDGPNDEFIITRDLNLNEDLKISKSLKDQDGDVGTSGQVLSSTGTGTDWINGSGSLIYFDKTIVNDASTTITHAIDSNYTRIIQIKEQVISA